MNVRPVLVLWLAALVSVAAVARAQEVEDFEGYADTPELTTVWQFATGLDTTTNHTVGGTKSLRLEGVHEPLTGRYALNEFEEPVNLSGLEVRIWVRRDPTSISPTAVGADFEDEFGGLCSLVDVPITGTTWQQLIIDLDACVGFDNTTVVSLKLRAGNATKTEGTVAVNFDDLGVYVFVDGFEAGDTTRWSLTSPAP